MARPLIITALKLVPVHRRVAMVACLFAYSVVDLLGVGMLVPLLGFAVPGGHHGKFQEILGPLFSFVGLKPDISGVLILYAVLIALKTVFSIMLMYVSGSMVADLTQSMRERLSEGLMRARWPWLLRQSVNQLTHVAGRQAGTVGEMFHNSANLIAMCLQVLAYVILAFVFSWQAALLALALGGFVFIWFGSIVRMRTKAAKSYSDASAGLSARFFDMLTNVRSIRGMGRTPHLLSLMRSHSVGMKSSFRSKLVMSDMSGEILEPFTAIAIAVWFYMALVWWQLPMHHLFVIGLLLIRSSTLLFSIYRLCFRVMDDAGAFRHVLRILDETRQHAEQFKGREKPSLAKGLSIENLGFAYGKKQVLQGLRLSMVAGTVTALKGSSGAGKSTLVDILLGLQVPREGRILVDGKSLFRELDVEAWRGLIGYVPQEQTLFHDNIRNNITLGDESLTDEQCWEALASAGADDFVRALADGLDSSVGERGAALSGGQRQRIMLARALVRKPRLLVLDEATAALDPETERSICARVSDLARGEGVLVVAISHQQEWEKVADQVVEIRALRDVAATAD